MVNYGRRVTSVPKLYKSSDQSAKKGLAALLQRQPRVRVGDLMNLVNAIKKKRRQTWQSSQE